MMASDGLGRATRQDDVDPLKGCSLHETVSGCALKRQETGKVEEETCPDNRPLPATPSQSFRMTEVK